MCAFVPSPSWMRIPVTLFATSQPAPSRPTIATREIALLVVQAIIWEIAFAILFAIMRPVSLITATVQRSLMLVQRMDAMSPVSETEYVMLLVIYRIANMISGIVMKRFQQYHAISAA